MLSSRKQDLLDLLASEQLTEAFALLTAELAPDHPDGKRVANLAKRFQELEGRVMQGTLGKEEVKRLRDRIRGGLRDVVMNPTPERKKNEEAASTAKKILFSTHKEEAPQEALPTSELGFTGDISYAGSPSKKEESLVLQKGYGASYHTAVQAIRKCGMTMESGDRAGGRIVASAPGNTVARFGEVIHVWVFREERGRTKIHVVVDSANPDTVFDLGRHQQKLQALMHQLRTS